MALELVRAVHLQQARIDGVGHNDQADKKMVEMQEPVVWDILGRDSRAPIMLNRAPTLHRLGIQAFEPT